MNVEDFDWCRGVTSELYKDSRNNEQLLMLDLDDVSQKQAEAICYDLPTGIYVLQQSSNRSYNVISLNAFTFEDIINIKASIYHDDAIHLKLGIDRDKWITRLSAKGSSKRKPVLVDVIDTRVTDIPIPISKDHHRLFDYLYDGYELLIPDDVVMNPLTDAELTTYPSLAEKDYTMQELKEKVFNNND